MNWNRRVLSAAALLSLVSVQIGCVMMPNRIVIGGRTSCTAPDPARVARCSEIEVAIANSAGSIVYGASAGPGEVWGFVLRDDEFDKAALGHLRDRVGQVFAEELQRTFPDKHVWYAPKGAGFSAPNLDSSEHDTGGSAVCLLSYTYVIRPPRGPILMGRPTWAWQKRWYTHTCEVLVIESALPILLPRSQAYVPGMGWAHEQAFWSGDCGGDAVDGEYALDCTAEVELVAELEDLSFFRPKEVRLNTAAWESAILKWAEGRAADLVQSLATAHGTDAVER